LGYAPAVEQAPLPARRLVERPPHLRAEHRPGGADLPGLHPAGGLPAVLGGEEAPRVLLAEEVARHGPLEEAVPNPVRERLVEEPGLERGHQQLALEATARGPPPLEQPGPRPGNVLPAAPEPLLPEVVGDAG